MNQNIWSIASLVPWRQVILLSHETGHDVRGHLLILWLLQNGLVLPLELRNVPLDLQLVPWIVAPLIVVCPLSLNRFRAIGHDFVLCVGQRSSTELFVYERDLGQGLIE